MEAERKVLITLISSAQAKENFTFIHRGAAERCRNCRYVKVCSENLESGRIYRIVRLRERTLHCILSGADMRVVEVVEAEVEAAIKSKEAIEGSIITFKPSHCEREECENFELCHPLGLLPNDRCKILRVEEAITCPDKTPLRKAVILRVQTT